MSLNKPRNKHKPWCTGGHKGWAATYHTEYKMQNINIGSQTRITKHVIAEHSPQMV